VAASRDERKTAFSIRTRNILIKRRVSQKKKKKMACYASQEVFFFDWGYLRTKSTQKHSRVSVSLPRILLTEKQGEGFVLRLYRLNLILDNSSGRRYAFFLRLALLSSLPRWFG